MCFQIIHSYLNFVSKTSKVYIIGAEQISRNKMVGYWHGDSYPMQLILKQFKKEKKNISVLVTADSRGDFIEGMIEEYGAKAIRVSDGIKMKETFPTVVVEAKREGGILAASFDGPLGPRYRPKRLLFLLAKQADKDMVYIHFTYSSCIRLRFRWDNYVIPLPFTRIKAHVEDLGKITNFHLNSIKNDSLVLKYE